MSVCIHGNVAPCSVCATFFKSKFATPLAAVHARTTVGAAFVAPDVVSEKLVARIAEFLYGRISGCDFGSAKDFRDHAEDQARNLAQVLVVEFELKERK